MSTLLALGCSHRTAGIDLRERLALPEGRAATLLRALVSEEGISEAAAISTCNRTELYAHVGDGASPDLVGWLAQRNSLDPEALAAYVYRHDDAAAARHLFRVATGLDSLVLGEPQILGQVKTAWQQARGAGSLRTPLDRLFQQAFVTTKRARTDTRIGANPVSVASAAGSAEPSSVPDDGSSSAAWSARSQNVSRR